jgi:hypothetical protein
MQGALLEVKLLQLLILESEQLVGARQKEVKPKADWCGYCIWLGVGVGVGWGGVGWGGVGWGGGDLIDKHNAQAQVSLN